MPTRSALPQIPLRAVRLARGMGLRETAEKVPMDPAHLSRIERGLRRPSLEVLAALVKVLGLTEQARLLEPYLVKDKVPAPASATTTPARRRRAS